MQSRSLFVKHIGEKHTEQVARFWIGFLASRNECWSISQRDHDDYRRD